MCGIPLRDTVLSNPVPCDLAAVGDNAHGFQGQILQQTNRRSTQSQWQVPTRFLASLQKRHSSPSSCVCRSCHEQALEALSPQASETFLCRNGSPPLKFSLGISKSSQTPNCNMAQAAGRVSEP